MSSTHGEARNDPSNPYAQKWYGQRITVSKHADDAKGSVVSTSSVPRCIQRLANARNDPSWSRTINTHSPATAANRYEPAPVAIESRRPTHTHDVAIASRCSSANTPASQYADRARLASIKR
jgi:cell wall-associated NlpC family hydrolase